MKNIEAVMEGDALVQILDGLRKNAEKEALEDMLEEGEGDAAGGGK